MRVARATLSFLILIAGLWGAGAQDLLGNEKQPAVTFGSLQTAKPEAVREQAEAWLKATGKTDAATQEKLAAIWKQAERPLLDRVTATLALGSAQAATLLQEASNPLQAAPTKVPDLLTDKKASTFFRANLTMAYARALAHRRVFEEALQALETVRAEDVADPATYLFYRAVCEHGLLQKQQASQTINRLLDDVAASPERYKTVSLLMLLDMETWKDKDLGEVARKMENVERRLDLARGGPETQRQQKEIVRRLDEIIKKLENDAKGGGC
jgi:hypothetical protein